MLAAAAGHSKVVKRLIDHGGSLEVHDEVQSIPFDYAFNGNRVDVIRILLNHGQDPNYTDSEGKTLLMWAVYNNKFEIAKLLLLHGADPDRIDDTNHTSALFWSIRKGNNTMIELLARRGACMPKQLFFKDNLFVFATKITKLRENYAREYLEFWGLPEVLETLVLQLEGSIN